MEDDHGIIVEDQEPEHEDVVWECDDCGDAISRPPEYLHSFAKTHGRAIINCNCGGRSASVTPDELTLISEYDGEIDQPY